jgi:ABC-type nitrate/sulfonate/bicarbonate transport system ATPase subunit
MAAQICAAHKNWHAVRMKLIEKIRPAAMSGGGKPRAGLIRGAR